MKKIMFLLFLCSSSVMFAQTNISGRVLDADTRKPVSYVLIGTLTKDGICITDEEGKFSFKTNSLDTIVFTHLAYDSYRVSCDFVSANQEILLKERDVQLSEIVVMPVSANELLNKAIRNLLSKIHENKPVNYLVYSRLTSSTGGLRELYASVESSMYLVNVKKKTFHNRLHLTNLDIIANQDDKNLYTVKGSIPLGISFFWNRKAFYGGDVVNNEIFVCEREDDDVHIIIKLTPKPLNKFDYGYYLFKIDKQDTILVENVFQSIPELKDISKNTYKETETVITNHFSQTKWERDSSGHYYRKEWLHRSSGTINSCDIAVTVTINKIDQPPIIHKKKRLYSRMDISLLKSKFPQTPGFWKPFYDEPSK